MFLWDSCVFCSAVAVAMEMLPSITPRAVYLLQLANFITAVINEYLPCHILERFVHIGNVWCLWAWVGATSAF